MYMKKIVSAISALAIAASTFAAMTITANAAMEYEVLYGVSTTDESTGEVTVANQTDFTGDANESTGVTFVDGNYSGDDPYEIDGSVLYANTSNSWSKNFSKSVTTGKVYFSADYTVSANSTDTIQIIDNNGKAIFSSTKAGTLGGNGDAVIATIMGADGDVTPTGWCRLARKSGYRVNLMIDVYNKIIEYELVYSSGSSKTSTISGTIENVPVTSVKGLKVNKTAYGAYLDNVLLYSEINTDIPVKSINVNCNVGDNTIKTIEKSTVDWYVGNEYTYYWPAYIKTDDGLYKSVSSTYGKTVTLAENNTFDVEYALETTSTSYFADFDGSTPVSPTAFSNGEGGSSSTSGGALTAVTVDEAGVYKAVVHAGCKKGDNQRTGSFTVNGEAVGTVTYTNYSGTVTTLEDIELNEGDVVAVTVPRSGYQILDYVVLIKTGELEPKSDTTYTFEGVLSELLDKTFKATATYNGKTATAEKPVSELIDTTDISDTSNVKFGIVITGVPETAVISNIVIE